jgi:tetrahydromethanopterin S-methyltransferase subunit G
MSEKKFFTAEVAKQIGEQIGIDWSKFNVEQFRMGMDVELEHGTIDMNTNVTNDDPVLTGKIALAHLNEFSDYYTRLEKMEQEAEKFWENKI